MKSQTHYGTRSGVARRCLKMGGGGWVSLSKTSSLMMTTKEVSHQRGRWLGGYSEPSVPETTDNDGSLERLDFCVEYCRLRSPLLNLTKVLDLKRCAKVACTWKTYTESWSPRRTRDEIDYANWCCSFRQRCRGLWSETVQQQESGSPNWVCGPCLSGLSLVSNRMHSEGNQASSCRGYRTSLNAAFMPACGPM